MSMRITERVQLEIDRALDRYEAELMEAIAEHFGVTGPEQRSEMARKAVLARWARLKKRKK